MIPYWVEMAVSAGCTCTCMTEYISFQNWQNIYRPFSYLEKCIIYLIIMSI